ncbi:MAG: hypothetical protein ABEH78_02340 [Haloferacaceae archaeon]
MDLPEAVQAALNDESVAARVGLGGGDALFVTPSRTLVYRDEGLLSDESVSEYPHGAERIAVETGRRKSTVTLDYGLDGERTLRLPTDRLEDALHPVLAGVLNHAGVTESGEAIKETFLLSELTVVVTSERLVKHLGETVWDGSFDEYHYDDVVDIRFEEGDVATSVVIRHDDGQERFKVPNADDRARAFRECLVDAVLAHHGYGTLDAFREARAPDEPDGAATDAVDFGAGPDPLEADPSPIKDVPDVESGGDTTDAGTANALDVEKDAEAATTRADGATTSGADREGTASDADANASDTDDDSFAAAGFEPAGPVDEENLAAEVAALRETVEKQNELLRAQGERIERQGKLFRQLVEELRRGR